MIDSFLGKLLVVFPIDSESPSVRLGYTLPSKAAGGFRLQWIINKAGLQVTVVY